MAVASAGPYASLHLTVDRWPRQHLTTKFFTGQMPFLLPNQQCQITEGKSTEGKIFIYFIYLYIVYLCKYIIIGTACIVCGAESVQLSCHLSVYLSIHPSVCSVQPLHATAAGLLLWAPPGRRYQSWLQQWCANEGSATFSAYVGS